MTKVLAKKRPLTCVRAFQQIAHACLGDIERGHRSARRGDAEGIHRMRIGFTKLAAARKFFSAMVTDDGWLAIKREIAWLNGILGEARDNDVALAYVREMPKYSLLGVGRREIDRRVSSGHARVTRALASQRYQALLTKIRSWIDHGLWTTTSDRANGKLRETPFERFAPHRLRRWSYRLARHKDRPIESRRQHRVRIMAKRYRYMVEALPELGIEVSHSRLREAKAARELQRALGDLRDLHRIRRRIDAARKGPFKARESKLSRQTQKAIAQFS
ncbi:CHAD domain-containing protein [Tardiphaga sp. OK245]|uniref:CHAD domain-containing protein n=1 Tax=Tardiphaga sp. OK245 TaxID=1855306 RepID=UPI0008A7EF81|nr:CHAD domain-containing protein [Tardiphaga sp. OK245]SEI19545.1 CHAD domain-containing protein [Tardiphaga sp. OK245]